jgi:hypothetical protein
VIGSRSAGPSGRQERRGDVEKRTILVQLDSDPQPSLFDRIVAFDAGAEEVCSYGGVRPEQVQALVHGAIFTRGPEDLRRTALFVGGSDVEAGERLLAEVQRHLLPQWGLRVSVMLDANGANTTAAAAVRLASQHLALAEAAALVLGATGPVGQRVVRLLARAGARVRVGSRQQSRAAAVCTRIQERLPSARLEPAATATPEELSAALSGQVLVIAAGAAGARLLPRAVWQACPTLRLAIDLNAVPPAGIEGLEAQDKARERGGVLCYGALAVGALKMKLHKAAIARLFERNDLVLDAEEIYALAEQQPL